MLHEERGAELSCWNWSSRAGWRAKVETAIVRAGLIAHVAGRRGVKNIERTQDALSGLAAGTASGERRRPAPHAEHSAMRLGTGHSFVELDRRATWTLGAGRCRRQCTCQSFARRAEAISARTHSWRCAGLPPLVRSGSSCAQPAEFG
jgi:hypothetical protein